MIAYVWRTGLVEFGSPTPDGALKIAEGKGQKFRNSVQVKCRLAHPSYVNGIKQPQQYLLPGVPEAESEKEALEAIEKFRNWIEGYSHNPKEEAKETANKLGVKLAEITIAT